MWERVLGLVISALFVTAACSEESRNATNGDAAVTDGGNDGAMGSDGAPTDDGSRPPPDGPGSQLGDGTLDSVTLTQIYEPDDEREATDLDFDPATGSLWVVLREYPPTGQCTERDPTSCDALAGSTLEITDAGGANPEATRKQDDNAWHFMRRPTSIAFGVADSQADATPDVSTFFATCHEWRTGNFDDDPADFIGPAMWTSDPEAYSFTGPGGNGSHLDMLHASPWCMGIAHERANVYWVFNGDRGSIDRYDFHEPHIAGADDHSDGEITRYVDGQVLRVENVPSHMDFHSGSGLLYLADTGNHRIVRLDVTGATRSGEITPVYEPLVTSDVMEGAELHDVVAAGTLEAPSGLDIVEDTLFVTDNATSIIYAFDLEGTVLNQLSTGLPAGSLAGIVVGEDDKVYFVDKKTSAVYRIDVN